MLLGRRFSSVIVAAMLFFHVQALWGADSYRIQLSRPDSVGSRYTLSATGDSKLSQTLTVDTQPPRKHNDNFAFEIEGTVKVLAVDAQNQGTKLEFTVGKCLKNGKPLIDGGAVVLAENGEGRTIYSAKGQPLNGEVSEVLALVLMTHLPGHPTDDEVFGTSEPQNLGATWGINAEAALRSAREGGMPLKKENLQGKVTLTAVKEIGGKEALQVEGELTINHASGPMGHNAELKDASSVAHYTSILPNDGTSQPISQTQSMELHLTRLLTGPQGQHATIQADMSRSAKVEYGKAP